MTDNNTDPAWTEEMPGHEYHAEKELSSTQLSNFKKNPAQYQHVLANPINQSPAMVLGSVVHADVADLFGLEFVIAPPINKRTNLGKEQWANLQELAARNHLTVITEEVRQKGTDITNALCADPWVIEHFEDPTAKYELSGFFDVNVPDTDKIPCRIRPDFLTDTVHINWKVTANAEPHSFATHAAKMGYLVPSTGLYEMGFIALTGHGREHYLVTVESNPPYIVTPYRIPPAVVDWAVEETKSLLRDFAACRDADVWDGYGWQHDGEPLDLYPPNWIVSRRTLQEDYDEEGIVV